MRAHTNEIGEIFATTFCIVEGQSLSEHTEDHTIHQSLALAFVHSNGIGYSSSEFAFHGDESGAQECKVRIAVAAIAGTA